MELNSYCKINVGLKVIREREDGYHEIETIFQELDLSDTVKLEPVDEGWEFTCNWKSVPGDKENTCVKAYLSLKELFPDIGGIRIRLDKTIPSGAGLGGGSSNAAAVLKGLDSLFELGLSKDKLEEIGSTIGADVPFFIRGGTRFAEGIGDVFSPATLPRMGAVLLVVPRTRISTEWAYAEVKKRLTDGFRPGKFAAAIRTGRQWQFLSSWTVAEEFLENDFESLVFQAYPEIGEIPGQLRQGGALFASLSGTGSTVFGIFGDTEAARKARYSFSSPFQTFITHPTDR